MVKRKLKVTAKARKAGDVTDDIKEAFFTAVICGKMARVGKMLAENPELAKARRQGVTALQVAASYGHRGVANQLLENGADVNAASAVKDCWTALHMAASETNADMVKLLIRHGADIRARTAKGETAWDIASRQRSDDEINALYSSNGGPTIIEHFVRKQMIREKAMLKSLKP